MAIILSYMIISDHHVIIQTQQLRRCTSPFALLLFHLSADPGLKFDDHSNLSANPGSSFDHHSNWQAAHSPPGHQSGFPQHLFEPWLPGCQISCLVGAPHLSWLHWLNIHYWWQIWILLYFRSLAHKCSNVWPMIDTWLDPDTKIWCVATQVPTHDCWCWITPIFRPLTFHKLILRLPGFMCLLR